VLLLTVTCGRYFATVTGNPITALCEAAKLQLVDTGDGASFLDSQGREVPAELDAVIERDFEMMMDEAKVIHHSCDSPYVTPP
jgi:hypothetical protein